MGYEYIIYSKIKKKSMFLLKDNRLRNHPNVEKQYSLKTLFFFFSNCYLVEYYVSIRMKGFYLKHMWLDLALHVSLSNVTKETLD